MFPPEQVTSHSEHASNVGRPPNELDIRRITRMLTKRERYRYVSVKVIAASGGYHVISPCCSRTINNTGDMIDIARIEYDAPRSTWKLFSKNHTQNKWQLRFNSARFAPLMDCLNKDPEKWFWQ